MHDSARVVEELYDHSGRLVATGDSGHAIIGEVEIIHKSRATGKTLFTVTKRLERNDLLVTGAVYLSEKINNVRSTFLTTPVDVSLGVHTADELDRSAATIPHEIVCGIMVGCGGCGDTYNTVHKVHRTDLTVPSPVPFRVVPLSADLKGSTRDRYFLRVVRGNYAYYYGKKFTVNREINVVYEDGTVVPTNVNVLGDIKGQYIKTFTKYDVTVDETDIREGFKLTDGNTMNSRINTVGLITGYPGLAGDSADKGVDIEEYFNVRTITTLNTEDDALKDSESTVAYIYRFYFV